MENEIVTPEVVEALNLTFNPVLMFLVLSLTNLFKQTGVSSKYLPFVAIVLAVGGNLGLAFGTNSITNLVIEGLVLGIVTTGGYGVAKELLSKLKK